MTNLSLLAIRLKQLRESLVVTQDDLAKGVALSRQSIQNIEADFCGARFDAVGRIADFLGVSIGYFWDQGDTGVPAYQVSQFSWED